MDALQMLKSERDRVQKELNGLNAALKALGGGHRRSYYTPDTQRSREGSDCCCAAGAMG
jgi:hypothetical protein